MSNRVIARRRILRVTGGSARPSSDQLVAEEPMEVRVNGDAVAVTMRTPGNDFELALGFCLTEGIVDAAGDVATIRYCAGEPGPYTGDFNVVEVALRSAAPVPADLRRHVYTSSSCGICGTASIAAVRKDTGAVGDDGVRVSASTLAALPDRLRAAQRVFDRTGGLHAAGLFTSDGELVCLREDVGRHNAVDKLVGWAAMSERLPLSGHLLLVSGRVAFEIAQKALVAGVPVLAAVSAPSSLAVDLAGEAGMTLAGFVRGTTMNVYTGAERLTGLTRVR
ncbi:MAG TPA: formate dehydrogenase accessory sulfurtransferase FdhD [Egibacteraceae bacterium]|nr:formate dehydrogenase accessory sulfurtransferase FdhD [Egibacteraceae bacterium]